MPLDVEQMRLLGVMLISIYILCPCVFHLYSHLCGGLWRPCFFIDLCTPKTHVANTVSSVFRRHHSLLHSPPVTTVRSRSQPSRALRSRRSSAPSMELISLSSKCNFTKPRWSTREKKCERRHRSGRTRCVHLKGANCLEVRTM